MDKTNGTATAACAIWAKKNEKNGQFFWLPLTIHSEDTMEISGWLWNHYLADGQREYLLSQMRISGRNANEEEGEKLVRFLGGVHDVGKATPAFQTQKSYIAAADLDCMLIERLEKAGFPGISEITLASPRATHHSTAGEVLLHYFGIKDDIASIIGGHHGKPVSEDAYRRLYRDQKAYAANYFQSENEDDETAQRWKAVQRYFLEWSFKESELEPACLPEISKPGQVILSGLLIMADWIASNEYYFPLFPAETDKPEYDRNQRFSEGMQKWFRSLPVRAECPDSAESLYLKRFGFRPSGLQSGIYHVLDTIWEPGIAVIEAPAGSGKTEAALAAAEQFAARSGRSGIFFGLPTQATSDGIFNRILQWTESVADEYGNVTIRLVHGKAALNADMQALRENGSLSLQSEAENVDSDGVNGTVSVNEWFSGRKTTALDDFVVGTVDQFLLTALKQKHLALRHLGFSRKIVIIDEVHAYDAYMQQYLKMALRWAGAYRTPVILLSATLPAGIRNDLVREYMAGRGVKDAVPDSDAGGEADYPLVTFSDGDCVRQENHLAEMPERRVMLHRIDEKMLPDKIHELLTDGGIAGIIVNTVKRAQEIAGWCAEKFGRENVELLHAGFIATDRIAKEERLLGMIGKRAKRPYFKIVVGTQVLEQSLDIDFDVLFTDLCPMDLLIQRIGRMHRHQIVRPTALQKPVTYVMGTSDTWEFEEGAAYIYGDYLLAKTQLLLPAVMQIPAEVFGLVQNVYDEEKIPEKLNSEQKDRFLEMREEFNVRRQKAERKAKTFRIGRPSLRIRPDKYNLAGWLDTPSESESEEASYAQVRDAQPTVEVIGVRKIGAGYTTFQGNEDISQRIEDPETDRLLAQQTLRLPLRVTAYGKTDEVIRWLEDYNRRYLSEWQKRPWLKGMLGIVFDEKSEFSIGDTRLHYDSFMGLKIVEDKNNGKV